MSDREHQSDTEGFKEGPDVTSQSKFIVRLNAVDYLTLSSVITTCFSVVAALEGYLYFATSLLYIAMLADAYDGILAREYGLERSFGRYLDGFMDVLIYLVAPSLIWYLSGFSGIYGIFLVAMIAAGCIRLSVFNEVGNIEESDGLSYLGMPVFWSVFILGIGKLLSLWIPDELLFVLLSITLTVFSYCMLYRARFFKFKSIDHILFITLGGAGVFSLIEFSWLVEGKWGDVLAIALYIQIPVVIGGVLHMVVVTNDYMSFLKTPIHEGLFGANKTWRGVIVVPLLTALGALCLIPLEYLQVRIYGQSIFQEFNLLIVGCVAGFGYLLAEFPNSFIKRRLGIAPGESAAKFKTLFVVMDQVDSGIGVAVAYWWVLGFSMEVSVLYIVTFPFVALLVKRLLFIFKLKKSAV